MSSQPKRKTIAQLRAEKEQRDNDLMYGMDLAKEVITARFRIKKGPDEDAELYYEQVTALLVQANCALDQLKHHSNNQIYRATFHAKADMHGSIGEYNMAITLLRQTDELYLAAERNGSILKVEHDLWASALAALGFYLLESHQLEAAKRCFMRILNWPHPMTAGDRVDALQGMARYYKERKDWPNVFKYCAEIVPVLPQADTSLPKTQCQARLQVLLADAEEGRGDLRRAREYDKKARKIWLGGGQDKCSVELDPYVRRKAIERLRAGKPHEAFDLLKHVPTIYKHTFELSGMNLMTYHCLPSLWATLKVMANAMVDTRVGDKSCLLWQFKRRLRRRRPSSRPYWEGVLEETRRELGEQRRAAAAAVVAPEVEEEEAATKKSKASKRKQQKRKAQQKKKAAEMAEAAAVTAAPEAMHMEEKQDQEETEVAEKEEGIKEAVILVAGLSAMAVSEQEEEEVEEEECSVCLSVIVSDDVSNPAGPPLVCGYPYHAFCLHFWVEKCRSKCIEPTCPYCRSPLPEMESA